MKLTSIAAMTVQARAEKTDRAPARSAPLSVSVDKYQRGAASVPWTVNVARAGAAGAAQPDPSRHEHAVYTVTVTGFSSKDVGETFGKGELFVQVAGFPRMPWVKAGRNEWVSVPDPKPFTLGHKDLDLTAGTVRVQLELFDYDPASKNDLLAAFDVPVKLDELAKTGQIELDLQSADGTAKAKATIRRKTIDMSQVTPQFIAKRDGDWARIASDYSTQVELQFRAHYHMVNTVPGPGYFTVRAPGGWATVTALQEDALEGREAIVGLDRDLPRRQELVSAYNDRIHQLRSSCIVREEWYDADGNLTHVLHHFPFEPPNGFLIRDS